MTLATVLVPLVFAVVGALIWALASNPKLQRIGEICMFWGIGWLVYVLSHTQWHL